MFLKNFWPAILWAIFIFFLCSTPGKSIPSADWMQWVNLDKWIHAFLYFVLFILMYFGYRNTRNVSAMFWVSFICCVTYGVGIELFQAYFLTDRSGDIPDAVANAMGAVFGIFAVKIYWKQWPWLSQIKE
jgi:glycopeptide antibiotics resistance protein